MQKTKCQCNLSTHVTQNSLEAGAKKKKKSKKKGRRNEK